MTHVCGCRREDRSGGGGGGSGKRSSPDQLHHVCVPSAVIRSSLGRFYTQPITELLLTSGWFVCRSLITSQEGRSRSSSVFLSGVSPALPDADESLPRSSPPLSSGFCGWELLSFCSSSSQTLQEGGGDLLQDHQINATGKYLSLTKIFAAFGLLKLTLANRLLLIPVLIWDSVCVSALQQPHRVFGYCKFNLDCVEKGNSVS